uniref:Uncharacterized protein n=1 Tax=Aegilops tauschii subsp. strangulata TaxID=200361 RepID=A0A453KUX9_AEGTS
RQVPRRRLHRRRPRGHLRLPAGAPGAGGVPRGVRPVQRHLRPRGRRAGGLREVPRLLRRAPSVGPAGGRARRPGHRGAPALLRWSQVMARCFSCWLGATSQKRYQRPASEAVPYFEQIGPLINQLTPMMETSPVYSVARDASGNAWKALFDLAGGLIREYDQEAMVSVSKFVDQLPSVMNQVTEGVSEFKPTPPENREFCKNSYSVANTLLGEIQR